MRTPCGRACFRCLGIRRKLQTLSRSDNCRRMAFSVQGHKFWQSAKRSVLATLGLGLLTAVCFRLRLNFATTSFIYLLVVVMQSLTADFASSAIVAFVAVACLDYFFVPPLFSFNVTDLFDLLALSSFLITALVITRFASKAHEEARASALRPRFAMRD